MRLLNHIKTRLNNQRKRIDERPNWQVAMLGAAAITPALYWGLMLKDVTPGLIDATNKTGLTLEAIALWTLVGLFGVQIWFLGCAAKKCHDILFKRMFDAL